jgi:ribose 5-phosphate isomerase
VLKGKTGVVDHGLFIGMATFAITVNECGTITEHTGINHAQPG